MPGEEETTQSFSQANLEALIEAEDHVVAALVVMCGDQVGRRYLLQQKATIGRTAQTTIYIPDPQISRHHAEIVRDAKGEYIIVDMDSRNGTLVNGLTINSHHLRLGDQVQLGGTVLLFTRRDPGVEQLLQKQKLEALGRIGAGIAHDFNNLLGAVMASLDYLGTQPRDSRLDNSDISECLSDIRMASERATDLAHRLLGFARHNTETFGPVDLTGICEEVAHLTQRTFMRSIQIDANVEPGLQVTGDRIQLHQMLMNLCINARDAMPDGGTITITGNQNQQNDTRYAEVIIRDTGTGMDFATQKRAFDPFYTTKKQGQQGSGLGLATVLEVVTAHGGRIMLDTQVNAGTTFTILIPLGLTNRSELVPQSTRLTSKRRISPSKAITLGDTGLILLVEDEVILCRSTRRLLEQAGHKVVSTNSGKEALAWFHQSTEVPDLLLLDMNMPGMSGADTFRSLRKLQPQLPAVIYSGYWTPDEESSLRSEGILDFIQKPFDAQQLRETVAKALKTSRRIRISTTEIMSDNE